jgi:hypothetical protein
MAATAQTRAFRDAVCQKFRCVPETYAETVFSHALYPHATWPTKLIRRLSPGYFDADFLLIRQIATCNTPRELRADVDSHRYHHPPRGFLRRWLRIRLSGQRVIILGARVFHEPPAVSSSPQTPAG